MLAVVIAPAQTLIVDSNNGPGTDYTDLITAATAAPDGAALQVRAGFYFGEVLVDGKGLTVLCEPGVVIVTDSFTRALRVQNLGASQSFALHGAVIQSTLQVTSPYCEVSCLNNLGPVLIEQLSTQFNFRVRISAVDCAQLVVRDSIWAGVMQQTGGRVALERCSVGDQYYGSHTVRVDGGELVLTDGYFTGGPNFASTPGAAVQLQGGAQLRVLGGATLAAGSSLQGGPLTMAAVIGNGTLRLDPAVTVLAGPTPFDPTVAVTTVAMPHVTTTSPALGAAIDVTLHGQTGAIGLLVGSPPSVPLTAPIFSDAWWLDPVAGVPLGAGIAPFQTAVATPANPALRGLRLNFQGLTWNGTGFDASNPSGWIAR